MRINKVEICGVDTSTLKTLSEERKRELLRLSKAGDRAGQRLSFNKGRPDLFIGPPLCHVTGWALAR